MRELEHHGGQGRRFPLTHSLAPLSLEDWHDFQATASRHTLPQRALIPGIGCARICSSVVEGRWHVAEPNWIEKEIKWSLVGQLFLQRAA